MFTLKSICHQLIHLFIALLFSHLVVVNLPQEMWLQLFITSYSAALLYCMVPAYLLIQYILMVSRITHKVFKQDDLRAKRLKYQFIFGFCLASVNTLIFVMMLGWIKGLGLFGNSYLQILLVVFLVYIFIVNAGYFLYNEYQKLPKLSYQMKDPGSEFADEINVGTFKANLPALIYHEDKANFAVDFNGFKTIWPNTIAESIAFLDSENYFQINRKVIIHRETILSFNTYQLRFIKIIHNLPIAKELITSRRKTTVFKEWAST